MIVYLNTRCPVCGLAMFTMPVGIWPPEWVECWSQRCPEFHKRYEPATVNLTPKGK